MRLELLVRPAPAGTQSTSLCKHYGRGIPQIPGDMPARPVKAGTPSAGGEKGDGHRRALVSDYISIVPGEGAPQASRLARLPVRRLTAHHPPAAEAMRRSPGAIDFVLESDVPA